MKLKTKRTILGLIAIIGLLLIPIGIYQTDLFLKTVFISVGGSIFGASLSNLFATLGMKISDFLSKSNKIPLTSTNNELNAFRTKYYCYYISRKSNINHWRMYMHDYGLTYASNYLEHNFKVKNDKGKEFKYKDISLVIEKRSIIIIKSQNGSESPSIYFMQNFGNEYAEHIVGVGIFENWDGNEMIAPMIMSKKPILGLTKEGRISNSKLEAELKKIIKEKLPMTVLE